MGKMEETRGEAGKEDVYMSVKRGKKIFYRREGRGREFQFKWIGGFLVE
jgi:hypothetical protein